MRRFAEVATRLGATPPGGASLKRMFAFWEAGSRMVSVPQYREAFCTIYGATPDCLGFPSIEDRPALDTSTVLELACADADTIRRLEAVTNDLRLVDRRLGSVGHAAVVEAHARHLEELLRMTVGRSRPQVAAALSEAAMLAGWLALDHGDVRSAWRWHDIAHSAALESGSAVHVSHVLAQQAIVLVDGSQIDAAKGLAAQASVLAERGAPALLRAWVLASEAEILAAAGEPSPSHRRIDQAARLLVPNDQDDLPFVMLDPVQLERWRGHCLAKLADPAALDALGAAMPSERTSVRAAASLHADLAVAHLNAGDRERSIAEAETALRLAQHAGSVRQVRRIRRWQEGRTAG